MFRFAKIILTIAATISLMAGFSGSALAQPADAATACIESTRVMEINYEQSYENEIVEIDTRDGSVVTFHDIRELVNLDYIRGMDIVVAPGQHIRSTEPLDGYLWIYPPVCEFTHVIEFVVRDRDYRASYDVPVGWFFADWRNTGVFQPVQ